jgi:DNA modification methylase
MEDKLKILVGDNRETLKTLPEKSVQCCITSPPYFGLRDYGNENQIGLEETPELYVKQLVKVFRQVWRVLRDDGVVWLNLGDSYTSNTKCLGRNDTSKMYGENSQHLSLHKKHKIVNETKPKDLIGIPWLVAFALRADGWYLRQDIIWSKPNPMPESVTDRCTKSHEYIFLLSKSQKYFYDAEAIKEESLYPDDNRKGRVKETAKDFQRDLGNRLLHGDKTYLKKNKRSVWNVSTQPFPGAHFAVFPPDLIEPCVLAGSKKNDFILDPFGGSGTTAAVALKHDRKAILCELNEKYVDIIPERINNITDALRQYKLF